MSHAYDDLQERLFREWRDESVFRDALDGGLDYLRTVRDRSVYPGAEAIRELGRFDGPLPDGPGDASAVLELLRRHGSPATVAMMGGRYFGFVAGGSIPVSIAAKNLATFWDQAPAMYVLSPLCAALETVVERWLREILGLPEGTVAGFVSGSSSANMCGLAAARWRVLQRAGWDVNKRGLFGAPAVRVVAGGHAHSTVVKALALLGFGEESITWVPADAQGRMIASEVPPLDERTILVVQAGNVNSGAYDPFTELCARANAAGAWVHVDGAFGLWAQAAPGLRHLTAGIERADSWAVDAHKTLNTPYDNGIVLCRDREALTSALHMSGGYIVLTGDQRDGMLTTPEMSRRARIVELWAAMAYLGRSGVATLVSGLHERSLQFAREIGAVSGFEVQNEVVFNQVLVRCATDELTARTIARIQELGECWVGGSTWGGRKVIRVSICSWATTADDVTRSVRSFERALREVGGA